MKFDLIIEKELVKLDNFEFDIYEEDSLVEILSIVENIIDDVGDIKFYFKCLNEIWNLTVFGDLSVFLEQLENIRDVVLGKKDKYILDFYEIGTDRKLLISKENSDIKIENYSKEKWKSPIEYELNNAENIDKNIITFVNKIKTIIEIACPDANNIKLLKEWYNKFPQK